MNYEKMKKSDETCYTDIYTFYSFRALITADKLLIISVKLTKPQKRNIDQ